MITEILRRKTGSQDGDLERLVTTRDRAERRTVDGQYLAAIEDRAKEMSDRLRAKVAEELRAEFNVELEARVAAVRNEYEGLLNHGGLPATTPELIAEIQNTEAQLREKDIELAKGLSDDSFPFGVIVKLRHEKLELDCYLRGLKFRANKLSETVPQ